VYACIYTCACVCPGSHENANGWRRGCCGLSTVSSTSLQRQCSDVVGQTGDSRAPSPTIGCSLLASRFSLSRQALCSPGSPIKEPQGCRERAHLLSACDSAQPYSPLTASLALFPSPLPLCGAAPFFPPAQWSVCSAIVLHCCSIVAVVPSQVKLACWRLYVTPNHPFKHPLPSSAAPRTQVYDKHAILVSRPLAHHATQNWGSQGWSYAGEAGIVRRRDYGRAG
jgi:hypothetical protein